LERDGLWEAGLEQGGEMPLPKSSKGGRSHSFRDDPNCEMQALAKFVQGRCTVCGHRNWNWRLAAAPRPESSRIVTEIAKIKPRS